jgi:hypothetical protein
VPSVRAALVVPLALALTGSAGCGAPADVGLARARATIQELGETIGSRPIGSPADVRARDYVVAALGAAGFGVRVQEIDAVAPAAGLTAHVANIIATREGDEPAAIALVAHYDSVPDGPGAQDDALGVATIVEAARELALGPLHHSLMVLVTDGEEVGLMGARGVVTDPAVATRVRAFLNFDSTGGTGPPVLFQAGPGRGDTLAAWAHGAPAPFGGSFGVEIYKRLPNDTDFTILSKMGASGLNFAPVGNSYVYHTDRDRPAGVADDTIAHEIANTVGIVRALDRTALARVDDEPTFFDLGEQVGLVYSLRTARLLGGLACAAGLFAWVLVTRTLLAGGLRALLWTAGRAVLVLGLSVAAMTGLAASLRALRQDPTPWYASPNWTFGLLAGVGCLVVWTIGRFAATRARRPSPITVWWAVLPIWLALGAFLLIGAPAASYLVTLPLGIVGLLLALDRSEPWLRLVSALTTLVVWLLWAANLFELLQFLVPMLGWLPIVTPVWLYPAVLTLGGVILVPPLVGLTTGTAAFRRLARPVGLAWGLLVATCGAAAMVTPTYTEDHPARRAVRYVEDDIGHTAWWELAGSDSRLVPTSGLPAGAAWTADSSPIRASVTLAALPFAREFRSSTPPLANAPADVRGTLVREADGRVTLHVAVTPRGLVSARLVLPPGLRPVSSLLTGVMQQGQWTESYVAVPTSNFEFQLTFAPSVTADQLKNTVVVVTLPGLPTTGAIGPEHPSWLPGGPSTWQTRSVFILPAGPEGA